MELLPQTLTYASGLMCYFLFWLIQFPFMLVPPQKIRWLFVVESFVVPPAWFAMLIWSLVKVPSKEGLFNHYSALSGSTLTYAWLSALNSASGIYGTLAVNIPDLTIRIFRDVIRIGQSNDLTITILAALRQERTSSARPAAHHPRHRHLCRVHRHCRDLRKHRALR